MNDEEKACLGVAEAGGAKRRRGAAPTFGQPRMSSWHDLAALENMLSRVSGYSLLDFIPRDIDRASLLLPGRGKVLWQGGVTERLSIMARLDELAAAAEPTLVSAEDQGSQNFCVSWFLTYHLGCSYVYLPDPHHRVANDLRGALRSCHLWGMILKTTLAANFVWGPWQGCGFWNQLQDIVEDFGDLMAAQPALWESYWPRIAADLGLETGDAAAKAELPAHLRQLGLLRSKGTKVGQCRWFSWNHWFTEKGSREWHVRALVLICLCRMKGWSVRAGRSKPEVAPGEGADAVVPIACAGAGGEVPAIAKHSVAGCGLCSESRN